ncbi:hypothetical protein CSKR_104925 [Clonorchis sinensis]|uniref:Small ribosomal subunit protein mS33 n=2 Tax=Clonorchis sinensis TaxID=79923 RepID=G7YC29_CLOSI|nr:hypothetical protein CSKR_104925 [Clonorchis sinensis]GAA50513.1 28S ribosomal protein S33 mitochondrial [Clonorchis sinensis]
MSGSWWPRELLFKVFSPTVEAFIQDGHSTPMGSLAGGFWGPIARINCNNLQAFPSFWGRDGPRMTSSYAKRMTLLAGRIFLDVGRPVDQKSKKVVSLMQSRPPPVIHHNYYPPLEEYHNIFVKLRYLGLFRDEHADFRDEMRRLRELKGKGKRKKGEGRRSTLS